MSSCSPLVVVGNSCRASVSILHPFTQDSCFDSHNLGLRYGCSSCSDVVATGDDSVFARCALARLPACLRAFPPPLASPASSLARLFASRRLPPPALAVTHLTVALVAEVFCPSARSGPQQALSCVRAIEGVGFGISSIASSSLGDRKNGYPKRKRCGN